MSDPTHIPGPLLSVPCDDDGCVDCVGCGLPMLPADAWMILRVPDCETWVVLCYACTRHAAKILLNSARL